MAVQRPLVLIGGDIKQLPTGDTVAGSAGGSSIEPMLASGNGNLDVVYWAGTNPVPDFVLSLSGDLMMGSGG